MKRIHSAVLLFISYPMTLLADGQSFSIGDPKGLFDKESTIGKGFVSADWMVTACSGLFAIVCFVSAGNYARQGHWGRSVGAFVGGIISAIGIYLVNQVR